MFRIGCGVTACLLSTACSSAVYLEYVCTTYCRFINDCDNPVYGIHVVCDTQTVWSPSKAACDTAPMGELVMHVLDIKGGQSCFFHDYVECDDGTRFDYERAREPVFIPVFLPEAPSRLDIEIKKP